MGQKDSTEKILEAYSRYSRRIAELEAEIAAMRA